jgi:carbonic anhydrase/acetyltransferase-like protein (isoleucine patch superfamily)
MPRVFRARSARCTTASVLLAVPVAVAVAVAVAPLVLTAQEREHHAPVCPRFSPLRASGSVYPAAAGKEIASYVDPTVHRVHPEHVRIGCRSFVAPFVTIDPLQARITIGSGSNLQDNVTIRGAVVIGDLVSIAHGATLSGGARVGTPGGLPAFVGFNSLVDGAIVEPDAMVTHLVKVSPGITIRAGTKVLPGKWIRTQAEADSASLGKVTSVTDADRAFMRGVLHVNTSFAAGYAALAQRAATDVRGASRDPGHSDFNADADQPAFLGKAVAHPAMHVRVIGGVRVGEAWRALDGRAGRNVSIRADEGEHFSFGAACVFDDQVTFHALEHSNLAIGAGVHFGTHVVVHGGEDALAVQKDVTTIGSSSRIGSWAVVFRSQLGDGVQIGERSYIDGSQVASDTVIPPGTILIRNRVMGIIEW